jgi:signal transduction histidine kinase
MSKPRSTVGRGGRGVVVRSLEFAVVRTDEEAYDLRRTRFGDCWQYRRGVSRFTSFARRHGFDMFILVGALAAALEVGLRVYPDRAAPSGLAVPAVALLVLLLLGRRRFPFGAPAAVWVLAVGLSFVDGRLIAGTATVLLAGMAAGFLLGALHDALKERIGLAVVLIGALLTVYNDPEHVAASFILTPTFFAGAWFGGFAVRQRVVQAEAAEERARNAEEQRATAARIAVAEERTRIARELHDIVAHAVSVMVLQVGAVRHGLPRALAADKQALATVEQAGRSALAEMRQLLGAMRQEGQPLALTPQPGLDNLDGLMQDVVRAGLPVELHIDGDPAPLPRAIDVSAYRIIQEALTNVLKHARATHADVLVRYEPEELEIEVRDDGRGTPALDGVGHGLVGIRERVKIYGGQMSTHNAENGGFVLRTRLPIRETRP